MKVKNGYRSYIIICIYFVGDFEDLKVIMKSIGVIVNIIVEEVFVGEVIGEYFILQMVGVILLLLIGKLNELQVYIVFLKSQGIKISFRLV